MTRHSGGLRSWLLGLTLLLSGCSDNEITGTQDSLDPLLKRVADLGFRTDMIEDRGDYFLVEGDIVLRKSDLRPGAEDGLRPSFQAVTHAQVARSSVQSINVDLRALTAYPEWATAARTAMSNWSNLAGAAVRFREDSRFSYQIVVTTYRETCPSSGGCIIAQASFPIGSGLPGTSIRINLSFNKGLGTGGQPTASSRVHNMVHEFGHTIGFRHTNWQQRGESFNPSGANTVPGTPTSDGASVMNGGTANNNYIGFSYWDRVAARKVYLGFGPATAGSIELNDPGTIEDNHPRLIWTPLPEAQSYNIKRVTPVFDPEYGIWVDGLVVHVGSTAGTAFVDNSRKATQVVACGDATPGYFVQANFPEGITTYGHGGRICFF